MIIILFILCFSPNAGFLAQLRLYEAMKNTLNEDNIDYKIFSLYHLGRKVSLSK